MPSQKTRKTPKKNASFRKKRVLGFVGKKSKVKRRFSGAVGNPNIKVRKATYSKAARYAVLANAEARQKLIEMGGENTIDVIREFDCDMSDEELARKTSMKASDVRVVLNRLHSQGLFTYTRVRDKDSGWYTYIWKLCDGKLKEFVEGFQVENQGGEEIVLDGDAYTCPNCAPTRLVAFEEASEQKFKCQECGSDMSFFERKRR